jgi:pyruvate dehydrogenase E2 component (dihydrolipoamide acetyltransferase)
VKADVEARSRAQRPPLRRRRAAAARRRSRRRPGSPSHPPATREGLCRPRLRGGHARRHAQDHRARLTEAKQTIPHFYLRRDIQLDALLKFRGRAERSWPARGVKLSVNDFIIKACALALQEVPDCNAVWAGDRVLKFKASDVAVAVAIEGGLFTPVI